MQLWLFSQPQPLSWLSHNWYKVPYQLHCWPVVPSSLEEELSLLELSLLDQLEELEEVPPVQTSPDSVGRSMTPPLASTCMPNSTV